MGQGGNLITNYDALKELTFSFYRDNYIDDGGGGRLTCSSSFHPLSSAFLDLIQADFDASEIKDAMFSMGPLKAPGPEGFQPIFFNLNGMLWRNLQLTLSLRCFADPSRISQVNETLIVLVPKIESPKRITHY